MNIDNMRINSIIFNVKPIIFGGSVLTYYRNKIFIHYLFN